MDKNVNRVSFRPDLLKEYPRLKDFFKAVNVKDRAKALLAMSEAFAITYAKEGTRPQHRFYLAESVRSGNVPLAIRTDAPVDISISTPTLVATSESAKETPVSRETPALVSNNNDDDDWAAEINAFLNPPEAREE